jgi:hypothetical protein
MLARDKLEKLGEMRSEGRDLLLLAKNRGGPRESFFFRFVAPDLRPVERWMGEQMPIMYCEQVVIRGELPDAARGRRPNAGCGEAQAQNWEDADINQDKDQLSSDLSEAALYNAPSRTQCGCGQ